MATFATELSVVTFTHDEWLAEAVRLFGPDARDWRFECPACHHIASGRDWLDAGAKGDNIAFSCIGRWLAECRDAFADGPGPCNYAGGGLIGLNPVRVVKADGTRIDAFAFAPALIADHATGRTGRAQARSGSADAGETATPEVGAVGDVGGEGREAGSGAERSTGGETVKDGEEEAHG